MGNKSVYTCKVLKTLQHIARTPEMFDSATSGLGIYVKKIIIKQYNKVLYIHICMYVYVCIYIIHRNHVHGRRKLETS